MSRRQRRTHDDNFKARIALEAIKEIKTIAQIASENDLHPNQVTRWKSEFLEKAPMIFSGDKKSEEKIKDLKDQQSTLHQKIGNQAMEIDFLKKKCKQLGLL